MKQVHTFFGLLPMDGVQESKADECIREARDKQDFFMLDLWTRVKEAHYIHLIEGIEEQRDQVIEQRDQVVSERDELASHIADTQICPTYHDDDSRHIPAMIYDSIERLAFKMVDGEPLPELLGHLDDPFLGKFTFDELLIIVPDEMAVDPRKFYKEHALPDCFLPSGYVCFDSGLGNDKTIEKKLSAESFDGRPFLPPGKYWVGDLCYILTEENGYSWEDIVKDTDCFASSLNGYYMTVRANDTDRKGQHFFSSYTMHGDGSYGDPSGNFYGVDAGIIGCFPVCALPKDFHGKGGGVIHEFNDNFDCIPCDSDGIITIGHVLINTAP